MTRALAAAAVAAVLAALAPAAAPAAALTPEQLMLRLPDLGPGYELPDGPECASAQLWTPFPRALRTFRTRVPHDGCRLAFARTWTTPGVPAGPDYVLSTAFVFPQAAGAAAALALPRGVAASVSDLPFDEFAIAEPAPVLGDEAVLLQTEEAATVVVVWRAGPVVGSVLTFSRRGGDRNAQAALRLAAAQQARIAAPTPLDPAQDDDLEVPLDDPRLDVPVLWLGRGIEAHGALPPLALQYAERASPRESRTGFRAALHYGRRVPGTTVTISLLAPTALRQRALRRELRDIAREPCRRIGRFGVPAGRVTIFARRRGCSPAPEGTFALVRRSDVIAGVFVDGCVDCESAIHRYDSVAGIRRLVRALRLRPSPYATPPTAPPVAPPAG